MSHKIVIKPIQFDDEKQKKASTLQFTTSVIEMKDGKEVFSDRKTDFLFHEFSTLASEKFITEDEKRDFLKIPIFECEKACVDFANTIDEYDDALANQKETIFGKFSKLYHHTRSVKDAKDEDDLEQATATDNSDGGKLRKLRGCNYYYKNKLLNFASTESIRKAINVNLAKLKNNEPIVFDDINVKVNLESGDKEIKISEIEGKKPRSVKLKLKTGWNYYYNGTVLDYNNTIAIKKAVSESLAKGTDKKNISSIPITIKIEEDGSKVEKKLTMGDIESKKEIFTKIYYRSVENLPPNTKKVTECESNEELEQIYGEPVEKKVSSPKDLDALYKMNCYVRFAYSPSKVWAQKNKGDDGKRKTSLQFICQQIDIIHIKSNYATTQSSSPVKSMYTSYAFGSRPETVFNATKKVEKEVQQSPEASDDESEEETKPVAKTTPAKSTTKNGKQSLKVESEEEESEEEESEEEESESEEEEPEPPKKSTKSKTVVEEPKAKAKAPAKKK